MLEFTKLTVEVEILSFSMLYTTWLSTCIHVRQVLYEHLKLLPKQSISNCLWWLYFSWKGLNISSQALQKRTSCGILFFTFLESTTMGYLILPNVRFQTHRFLSGKFDLECLSTPCELMLMQEMLQSYNLSTQFKKYVFCKLFFLFMDSRHF